MQANSAENSVPLLFASSQDDQHDSDNGGGGGGMDTQPEDSSNTSFVQVFKYSLSYFNPLLIITKKCNSKSSSDTTSSTGSHSTQHPEPAGPVPGPDSESTLTASLDTDRIHAKARYSVYCILAFVRMLFFVSWFSEIGLYFTQINGKFPQIECPGSLPSSVAEYCSETFLYSASTCQVTSMHGCSVNLFEITTLLITITLAQSSRVSLAMSSVSQVSKKYPNIASGMNLTANAYSIALFALEAYAMPYALYNNNDVVIVNFNARGINITGLIVLLFMVFVWLSALAASRAKRAGKTAVQRVPYMERIRRWYFLLMLSIFALALHSIIVTIIHTVNSWSFFKHSRQFFLFSKPEASQNHIISPHANTVASFSAFQTARSAVSMLNLVQSVLIFGLKNMLDASPVTVQHRAAIGPRAQSESDLPRSESESDVAPTRNLLGREFLPHWTVPFLSGPTGWIYRFLR
jgi:hypothetical protein